MKFSLFVLLVVLATNFASAQEIPSTYCFTLSSDATSPYHLLPDDYHVFSGRRYQPPPIPVDGTYASNAAHLASMAERSPSEALDVWLGAVSGGLFPGRGTSGSFPNEYLRTDVDVTVDASGQPHWDYGPMATNLNGNYSESSFDAGNFNYAVTGYTVITALLSKVGLDSNIAEEIARNTLRFGGGAYQMISDLTRINRDRHWSPLLNRTDRTWYGEDKRDARIIEDGFRHAEFLKLERAAKSVGATVTPEAFGVRQTGQSYRFSLFDRSFRFDETDTIDQIVRESTFRRIIP